MVFEKKIITIIDNHPNTGISVFTCKNGDYWMNCRWLFQGIVPYPLELERHRLV
jgi:hypothetical protein